MDRPNWDDDWSEADDFEERLANCGMTDNGLCTAAGSEYCDWECGLLAFWGKVFAMDDEAGGQDDNA